MDVHGITFIASNKTSIASINVTVAINPSVERLRGIFHGYIIFHKEVDEQHYRTERLLSVNASHLIRDLKNWTSYHLYVRVLTLNGAGRKRDTKRVWTKLTGMSDLIYLFFFSAC